MSDSGVREEVQAANLLIGSGYLVRPHIQIYPDEFTGKMTDIDVFATKFDSNMNQSILLVECKKGTQKFADLFKLYGFKTYYGNCQAMFISDNIGAEFRETSDKLGIRATSFQTLISIVKQSGETIDERYTEDDLANVEEFLKDVKEYDKELYWRYHYVWLERDPFRRFYHLQRLFSMSMKANQGELAESPSLVWYRREVFILSLMCLAEMSSYCADVEQKRLGAYIESRFYDIGTPKEGKEKIRRGVDALVKKIEELSGEPMGFKGLELIPSYVTELVPIVKRFVARPKYAQSTLLLDDLIYRKNLHALSMNIAKLAKSSYQSEDVKAINNAALKILCEGPITAEFNDFV